MSRRDHSPVTIALPRADPQYWRERYAHDPTGPACLVLGLFLMVPSPVFAQASITGTVRDTSGAVLPGVTVEASSPALIEKVRTATTDGNGQYRIVDFRAGRVHRDV